MEAWSSPEWQREATEWIDARLAEAHSARTGEVEQTQLRPWATVVRVPTDHGNAWLKAAGPETAFEPGLYRILATVAGEWVLPPIAIDTERGWLLLPDGGPTLASAARAGARLDGALAEYARLQRAVAPQVEELIAVGVPDMRPTVMPERFDEALDFGRGHVEGADAAAGETYGRLEELRPTYRSWCERLAAGPGPPSIDHNDLHPGNILIPERGPAGFYDWGDAVVAHPFASMLLPLGYAQQRLDGSDVRGVRDSYLAGFAELAPHEELVETLELACAVAKAARALTWKRALAAAGPEERDRYAEAPFRALASILEGPYLWG